MFSRNLRNLQNVTGARWGSIEQFHTEGTQMLGDFGARDLCTPVLSFFLVGFNGLEPCSISGDVPDLWATCATD